MRYRSIVLGIVPLLLAASAAFGADFTRAEVESLLAAAPESPRPSFAGRSLAGLDLHALDLHEVDFTSADLSGADLSDADLRGAKLMATKLIGAKLPRAKLNLAWIMRADFSHADLSQSILETLVASAGMETQPDEAAKFVEANLSGAKVTARFSLDDMRGADLSHLKSIGGHAQSIDGIDPHRFLTRQSRRRQFRRCGIGSCEFRVRQTSARQFLRRGSVERGSRRRRSDGGQSDWHQNDRREIYQRISRPRERAFAAIAHE